MGLFVGVGALLWFWCVFRVCAGACCVFWLGVCFLGVLGLRDFVVELCCLGRLVSWGVLWLLR